MQIKDVFASILTIVLFLASFITGVWLIVIIGGPEESIAKIIHGVLAVGTLVSWIGANYRQEPITTRIGGVFFLSKLIVGISAVFIVGGLADTVLQSIHKVLAVLTLIAWIIAIRGRHNK